VTRPSRLRRPGRATPSRSARSSNSGHGEEERHA
jgi:hypothetical protein